MAKFIILTKGMRAVVDDEDYEKLNKYDWYFHETRSTSYAARYDYSNGIRKLIYMHRLVLLGEDRLDTGLPVDHISRNTIDNRRCNLREVTVAANNRNRKFN